MTEVRRWLSTILELAMWLVGMLVLLQILFGDGFVQFFGMDVVGNIGVLASKFGNAGLVGIIAAGLVAYLIVRNRPSNAGGSSASAPQRPQPPQPGIPPSHGGGTPTS